MYDSFELLCQHNMCRFIHPNIGWKHLPSHYSILFFRILISIFLQSLRFYIVCRIQALWKRRDCRSMVYIWKSLESFQLQSLFQLAVKLSCMHNTFLPRAAIRRTLWVLLHAGFEAWFFRSSEVLPGAAGIGGDALWVLYWPVARKWAAHSIVAMVGDFDSMFICESAGKRFLSHQETVYSSEQNNMLRKMLQFKLIQNHKGLSVVCSQRAF